MRRVWRDKAEVCAGPCEFADFLKQVIGHAGEIIRGNEIDSFLQIDAINDELRITAVAPPRAVELDDVLVIFDRALRAEAADDSEGLDCFRLHFLIKRDRLESRL